MRTYAFILACGLIAAPGLALADPTGTYNVAGKAADGHSYSGTVEVSRTGPTYKVVWNIDGKTSIGTGLGSHFDGPGLYTTGAASEKDTALSVGYVNKDTFGICSYIRRADGSWDGIWTYGGSQNIVHETWTPK
jgi:hypothetical protein